MNDSAYYRQRAQQSLDQAARTSEPMRSIHLELAKRYTETWRRACEDEGVMPLLPIRQYTP